MKQPYDGGYLLESGNLKTRSSAQRKLSALKAGQTKAVSFFLGFLINKAIVRGRPAGFSDGNKSAINSHISQLRLLGYDARHSRARGAGFYK